MKYVLIILLAFWGYSASVSGHSKRAQTTGVTSWDIFQEKKILHMVTTSSTDGKEVGICYETSVDGGKTWRNKSLIPTGKYSPHNMRFSNSIQLAASEQNVVIVWQIRGKGFMNSGPMQMALSDDGGKTWQLKKSPAKTVSQSFVDIAVDGGKNLHLTWLDTRNKARGLRYAMSKDFGKTWEPTQTVDAQTCACCWNTIKCAKGKTYILYRNDKPRDMHLATGRNGKWKTFPAGDLNWQFQGCPHVGGALEIDKKGGVHAIAWSGKDFSGGLFFLRGDSGVKKWKSIEKIAAVTAKESCLSIGDNGEQALAFIDGKNNCLVVKTSLNQGETWSKNKTITQIKSGLNSPKLFYINKQFRVFWIEKVNGSNVWRSSSFFAERGI